MIIVILEDSITFFISISMSVSIGLVSSVAGGFAAFMLGKYIWNDNTIAVLVGLSGALLRLGGLTGSFLGLFVGFGVAKSMDVHPRAILLYIIPFIVFGLVGLGGGIYIERSNIGWWL